MDVTVSTEIPAPPRRVASIMFDPRRDPEWIGGARRVDVEWHDPIHPGARVRRHGGFLGREFSWTTEVVEFEPDRLLRMRFVQGPMRGEVSYRIEPSGTGATVTIRNRGEARFSLPGMRWMVKRSVGKDLARLRALVVSA